MGTSTSAPSSQVYEAFCLPRTEWLPNEPLAGKPARGFVFVASIRGEVQIHIERPDEVLGWRSGTIDNLASHSYMPVQLTLNKGRVPVKVFTKDIEPEAMQQLINVAQLPIVFGHVAAMPDVHHGIGATVGSVIATKQAIIQQRSASISVAA